ncbi:MAG: spore coat protein [Treponema sp.]|nr:spore coat protein [Treponema sp.]
MTAIILQARIDSTRLPGKALLLLDGKPLIFHVMQALNNVPSDFKILACPEDSLTAFEPITKDCGFEIHGGPKEDVLERFCQVIKKYNLKRIIRATGDNPFVFADAAIQLNNEAISINADYAGYTELPYGAGIESVNAASLILANEKSLDLFDHEHVCPFLYNNPQIFNIYRSPSPLLWRYPDIRITIDTQEDFDRAVLLYNALKNNPLRHNGSTIIDMYLNLFK